MKDTKCDEIRRGYSLIGVLGITILALLMLVSIAGADPYAYISNDVDGTVSVIDTETNIVVATVPVGIGPIGVAMGPDGKNVYVANGGDNTVSIIDTETNTVVARVPVGIGPCGVAASPDGTKVYLGSSISPGAIYVIDTSKKTVLTNVPVGKFPYKVAITPDGTKVYVANSGSDSVSIIDTATNTVTATVTVGDSPLGIAVSPDGTKLYLTNFYDNAVSVINTTTNAVIATVVVGVGPGEVAVSPDGKNVYVTNSEFPDSTVSVINTSTNAVVATVAVGDNPVGIAFTPDGTKAYVTNHVSDNISVIDTATNTVIATVNAGIHPASCGQFIGYVPVPEPVIPVANFSSNVTGGYAPLSVQFIDLSTDTIGWSWDFGDGTTSVEQSPVHTYSAAGTYSVNLTAISSDGTDSKTATINVLTPAPTTNSISVPLDPVPVGNSITASANVTYLGSLDELTAEWDWGDGSKSQSQVSPNFEASHVYSSPGVYTVTFTVKDNNGEIVTQKAPNSVVVYDPQGGFVTGGGWINSPAGAYVPDNTLAGKATFGFVSKYENGATVPTGKTGFQFNVANLNFSSESYDWLIVAGPQAKYKGTGTINEEGNYGFMLNAIDGAVKGDGVDKFRIKIWDKESGNTIYDNEIGTSEDSEPSTAISGGSIIIHKKK